MVVYDFAGDDGKTVFRLSKGFDYFGEDSEFKRFGHVSLFTRNENTSEEMRKLGFFSSPYHRIQQIHYMEDISI